MSEVLAHYEPNDGPLKLKQDYLDENLPKHLENIQSEIDRLLKTLEELSEQQIDIENKIGISGSALLCLQKYSQKLWMEAIAYSKLVSLLIGNITSMTPYSGNKYFVYLQRHQSNDSM